MPVPALERRRPIREGGGWLQPARRSTSAVRRPASVVSAGGPAVLEARASQPSAPSKAYPPAAAPPARRGYREAPAGSPPPPAWRPKAPAPPPGAAGGTDRPQ